MLNRRSRFFAALVLLTTALTWRAVVFPTPAFACSLLQPESPLQFVAESEVIVVGKVVGHSADSFEFAPEAFLKGPVSGDALHFSGRDTQCPAIEVEDGDRLLIYVPKAASPTWPLVNEAYEFRNGKAYRQGEQERLEIEVVSDIRALTGQYAVPAASSDEGVGINWSGTVLPLSVVLVIVFGIGLVLMRTWHRIDPS